MQQHESNMGKHREARCARTKEEKKQRTVQATWNTSENHGRFAFASISRVDLRQKTFWLLSLCRGFLSQGLHIITVARVTLIWSTALSSYIRHRVSEECQLVLVKTTSMRVCALPSRSSAAFRCCWSAFSWIGHQASKRAADNASKE